MNRDYSRVAVRAGHRCEYCRAPEQFSNLAFEVEHIVPPMFGGITDVENLALACRSCNLYKSNFLTCVDHDGVETGKLFDPRNDVWEEHFKFNPNTLEIEWLTKIGRGTVFKLRMNSEMQKRARSYWRRADGSIGRME